MSEDNLKRRLTPMDAFFLYIEREEQPMSVGAVCIFEGKMSYRQFVQSVSSRLHMIPRYLQKIAPTPLNIGHPTWEDDPDFDIKNHIFRVKLDAPGDEAQLRTLTGEIMTGTLDRDKPLWEIYFVEGLANKESALIFKVHHCMVDGVAGVGLAFVLMDVVPDPPKVKKVPYKPKPMPDNLSLLYNALWDNAADSIEQWTRIQKNLAEFTRGMNANQLGHAIKKFVLTMGNFLLPYKHMPFNKPLSGERLVVWREFPFADARAVRAACGGTVNDVILSVIGTAVRHYLEDYAPDDIENYESMRVLVPVNVRQENERASLGNRISFLPVEVPLNVEDSVQRLQSVALRMREMKQAKVSNSVGLMFEILQASPAPVQAAALSTASRPLVQSALSMFTAVPPANLVCTNVPGPQIPLYVAGKRMHSLNIMLPVCLEMGINFGIVSYDQKISVTIIADAQAGYDLDVMMEYFEASFQEMLTAAEVKHAKYVEIVRERDKTAEPPAEDAAKPAESDNGRKAAAAASSNGKSAAQKPTRAKKASGARKAAPRKRAPRKNPASEG